MDSEDTIVESVKAEVKALMDAHGFPGHDYAHALAVWRHSLMAIKELDMDGKRSLAIQLACLLHDVDDKKIFPARADCDDKKIFPTNTTGSSVPTGSTVNFKLYNATEILAKIAVSPDIRSLVYTMIELVSCSENGNSLVEPRWLLVPRDCDRIEALGRVGIQRCREYCTQKKLPRHTLDTPRCKNIPELYTIATKEKFERYQQGIKSASEIDHYYEKLLHICKLQSGCSYLQIISDERRVVMEEYVLNYWIQQDLQEKVDLLEKVVESSKIVIDSCTRIVEERNAYIKTMREELKQMEQQATNNETTIINIIQNVNKLSATVVEKAADLVVEKDGK